MKTKAVYFDLDGVMADYSGGFLRDHPDIKLDPSLNRSSHLLPGSGSAKKRAAYERIQGTTFYADLPILPGAERLYAAAYEAEPIILTAAPKFGASEEDYFLNPYWLGAAFHKRNWVECVFLPSVVNHSLMPVPTNAKVSFRQDGFVERIRLPDERFICTTSARKFQFMHRKHSDQQILVDDRTDNIDAWNKAGGIGILHTDSDDSIQRLHTLI